jgi:tRNA A37 threonylcarbamoyladenosine biosynthesis protein TsaE
MSVRRFISNGPRETIEIGGEIAHMLSSPTLLFLRGDLGAGKTTLVKGIAQALDAADPDEVTSPTFTLVHEYDGRQRVKVRSATSSSTTLTFTALKTSASWKPLVSMSWPRKKRSCWWSGAKNFPTWRSEAMEKSSSNMPAATPATSPSPSRKSSRRLAKENNPLRTRRPSQAAEKVCGGPQSNTSGAEESA